jgi:hypothetical protein
MTEADLRRRFPFASAEFIRQNVSGSKPIQKKENAPQDDSVRIRAIPAIHEVHPRSPSSRPKPEQALRHESLATEKGKSSHSGRLLVRITSFRRRLCDPDNLIGKYFVDCLRYCGILSGDTEAQIDFRISQQKVKSRKAEKTLIEVEPI